ncbi:flagellar brake protein [Anoxynatronum sibiricum]|uniref:Flagellar brake protein n=1 Tax=Anoxynatronum sibiricum TaxID=210623 RepID=A0ABU9VQX5_9CLOT
MEILLETGDKVDVRIHHPSNPEGYMILYSQVMNVDSEFYYLTPPVSKGVEYPIRVGQKADIIYYREAGIYMFQASFLKKVKDNYLTYFQIARLTEPEKTQRREFFRLKYMLQCKLRSLENDQSCDAIVQDISGGGVRMISPRSFYVGEKIECTLHLDEHVIAVAAKIVRSQRMPHDKRYEIGAQFIDVSEQNQNKIVGYIFHKQGELRQKGLV